MTKPSVDFLIFSDTTYKESLPENVKIIPFNLENYNVLATKSFSFNETNFEQIEIIDKYDILNIDCEIESM